MFLPTKSAAHAALESFLPHAAEDYTQNRNYDLGQQSKVSRLSPWVRNRVLPEWEIVSAVLEQHATNSASKFIDEICWRTYWKGWLQLRPAVWENYRRSLSSLIENAHRNRDYLKATEGRTGIDCFDTWATELIETNYLHNHARMWYASIWVHTLKLPWQLGADWFMRHLLDGDPASNTLSWRWVAGLHTQGKTYLAQAENIRKYTGGRFRVDATLANEPISVIGEPKPQAIKLSKLQEIPTHSRLGLLVTDDDLSLINGTDLGVEVAATSGLSLREVYKSEEISKRVIDFRFDSMRSLGVCKIHTSISEITHWAKEEALSGLVVSEPCVGAPASAIDELRKSLEAISLPLHMVRSQWDDTLYPHATHGFFRFKKAIPQMLEKLTKPGTN